jgi:CelD/BcsL family acetyltransferase involved in cellulose biosynthesis
MQADLSVEEVHKLKMRVETDFVALEELRELWDETMLELGGSIYMSYDWSRTWWEFYGARKQLRIFLFYNDLKLVGIVPIYIDRLGFKPFDLSVARLVGSNIPPKAFNPAVHPEWAEPIFDVILKQILEKDRCDLVSIGPVRETSGFLQHFERAARKHLRLCAKASRDREGVDTVFHLPNTMEQFFEAMDKDERKKRKYEMRLLAKEPSVGRDVITLPDQTEAEFESFTALHASQWRDKGKLGHFGSWPKGKQYNLALVQSLARLGRVRFVRILVGGEVVSSQFAFVFGNTWYWELPARVIDRKWNRFSLGTTGFFGLVEQAIKEGGRCIEGGLAHYDYKQKLNGTEHGMDVLRVVANRPESKVLTVLYTWLRKCLLLAYYKIWYSRISPRLPAAFRKPIWSFWLRLDF